MSCEKIAFLILESIIKSTDFTITNLDTEYFTYIVPDENEIIKQEKELTIDFELENLFDYNDEILNYNIEILYNDLYKQITDGILIITHKFFHRHIVNHILGLGVTENIVFRVRTNNSSILYNELIDMGIDIDLREELQYS